MSFQHGYGQNLKFGLPISFNYYSELLTIGKTYVRPYLKKTFLEYYNFLFFTYIL